MSAIALAETADLPRADWLELRRQGIGGSDVAAILGLDEYRTPYQVWCDKVYGEVDGHDAPAQPVDDDEDPRFWGTVLEPVVAQRFEQRTGLVVRERKVLLQDSQRQYLLANMDRELATADDQPADGLLECKTTGVWQAPKWADGIPDYAALQAHHYLGVTGFAYAYVAVLIGGQRYRHFRVDRDEDLLDDLRKVLDEFWQSVIDRVPPPIDGSARTRDLLERMYAVETPGSSVDLTADGDEVRELLDARRAAKHAAKDAEAVSSECDNRLRALIGDCELATLDGRPLATWKTETRKSYTVAESTHRTLRIKKEWTS